MTKEGIKKKKIVYSYVAHVAILLFLLNASFANAIEELGVTV